MFWASVAGILVVGGRKGLGSVALFRVEGLPRPQSTYLVKDFYKEGTVRSPTVKMQVSEGPGGV